MNCIDEIGLQLAHNELTRMETEYMELRDGYIALTDAMQELLDSMPDPQGLKTHMTTMNSSMHLIGSKLHPCKVCGCTDIDEDTNVQT